MVLEAITIGAIGVAYFTGNTVRKQKMRQIGSQVADVTKDVAGDVLNQTKHLIYKIQKNRAKKIPKNGNSFFTFVSFDFKAILDITRTFKTPLGEE